MLLLQNGLLIAQLTGLPVWRGVPLWYCAVLLLNSIATKEQTWHISDCRPNNVQNVTLCHLMAMYGHIMREKMKQGEQHSMLNSTIPRLSTRGKYQWYKETCGRWRKHESYQCIGNHGRKRGKTRKK